MTEQERNPSLRNQSTEKAMAVIELLAQARSPMRLRDISESLGLNASTALRFLASLEQCGYVEQERENQRYLLTYKICRIANQVSSRTELQTLTHPYLLALSERFQEAVCVSVERDMTMIYIDVATGPDQTLMSMQRIGNVSPMHCTGNGKLLLLNYTGDQIDEMIRRKGLQRYTPNTITTKGELLRALEEVRAADVALDNEECELGVRCVACPIRDYTGAIIAGISVTGPISRMTEERIQTIRKHVREAADKLSETLGYTKQSFNN